MSGDDLEFSSQFCDTFRAPEHQMFSNYREQALRKVSKDEEITLLTFSHVCATWHGRKNRLEEVQVFSDEIVFGVAYVYARQVTIWRSTGGMKVKADRDEARFTLLCGRFVRGKGKSLGITSLHMKLRAAGGTCTKTPGPGAQ
ncbi:conserved hypothetical protein [Culex quinquefasciatus]|uniref:Uncharacterized protein n=1 Tax=Culex quinquefasciatus TaxID=7176 RepID=B0XC98_CULQU|nr:conserved hypothetical protein [Culex quinquefasciatus]|eukprot:XP_001867270.1 conserved hypothetical protein [Culex quinquefasciatus]